MQIEKKYLKYNTQINLKTLKIILWFMNMDKV